MNGEVRLLGLTAYSYGHKLCAETMLLLVSGSSKGISYTRQASTSDELFKDNMPSPCLYYTPTSRHYQHMQADTYFGI